MRKPNFSSADEFLAEKKFFSLGHLPTEGFHPATANLHHLAQREPGQAVEVLRDIDLAAIDHLIRNAPMLEPMAQAISLCIESGHRVFLSGCGATGRLSLALESIWRSLCADHDSALSDRVQGLMAGGDIALVRSVESFEDIPEFGARHLSSLGFQKGDLLLAITEGGETPFVIGTVEHAAFLASQGGMNPYFLHCNPPDSLCEQVERSRKVYENRFINKISFPIGPMALSGSTRLQATTVLMLAAGECIMPLAKGLPPPSTKEIQESLRDFRNHYAKLDLSPLPAMASWEAAQILEGDKVLYETEDFGISILTDTTERSPTFSLHPFENELDERGSPISWAYLCIPSANNGEEAWKKILGRLPLGLEWEEYSNRLSSRVTLAFDFSRQAKTKRMERAAPKRSQSIRWNRVDDSTLHISNEKIDWRLPLPSAGRGLHEQMMVKLLLNIHSLLFMGILGRYEHNVMTWVRPSNGKLIDRSVRYAQLLLEKKGHEVTYEEITRALFSLLPKLTPNEPIVLHLLKHWGIEPEGHAWKNQ
jgi:N-acetylmuramic acid 6-phosphate etherase